MKVSRNDVLALLSECGASEALLEEARGVLPPRVDTAADIEALEALGVDVGELIRRQASSHEDDDPIDADESDDRPSKPAAPSDGTKEGAATNWDRGLHDDWDPGLGDLFRDR